VTTTPLPPNTAVTITLTGHAIRDLQAAIAMTAVDGHLVRIAVDVEPDDPDHPERQPITTARFKVDEELWSPPVYATAEVTAPAYDDGPEKWVPEAIAQQEAYLRERRQERTQP
jgi:hypothetical protein